MTRKRKVVTVGTGHYVPGVARLTERMAGFGESVRSWTNILPLGSPTHAARPYAFKAYALKIAAEEGAEMLLWCDASVVPIRPLARLWDQIEADGYWIARNGWDNSDWTADSAYPDLFPEHFAPGISYDEGFKRARAVNARIPHVVGTAFGLDIRHVDGRAFLVEYCRLAADTEAFCGPWKNTPETPCGPPTTLGHRHDQTAMSVIAAKLGCKLTDGPHVFSYALRTPEGAPIVDAAAYPDDTMLVAVGVG